METRIRASDLGRELEIMIDTLRAYHGKDSEPYVVGQLIGIIRVMAMDLNQDSRKYWLDDFQGVTKETTHKLMMEKLREKESTAA